LHLTVIFNRGSNRLRKRGIRGDDKLFIIPIEVTNEAFLMSTGARAGRQKVLLVVVCWSRRVVCVKGETDRWGRENPGG
jgi:hypothetical protein